VQYSSGDDMRNSCHHQQNLLSVFHDDQVDAGRGHHHDFCRMNCSEEDRSVVAVKAEEPLTLAVPFAAQGLLAAHVAAAEVLYATAAHHVPTDQYDGALVVLREFVAAAV
jgi:hypothetical protein